MRWQSRQSIFSCLLAVTVVRGNQIEQHHQVHLQSQLNDKLAFVAQRKQYTAHTTFLWGDTV